MGLLFHHLDAETRALMIEEIDHDGAAMYLSKNLTTQGLEAWGRLLREACEAGNDESCAHALRMGRYLKEFGERKNSKGGMSPYRISDGANDMLAEGQFNVYYMRALSRVALAQGKRLLVYRAKQAMNPRPESEQLIGTHLDPQVVLDALRESKGVNPPIGIPQPNSGLCVRLAD